VIPDKKPIDEIYTFDLADTMSGEYLILYGNQNSIWVFKIEGYLRLDYQKKLPLYSLENDVHFKPIGKVHNDTEIIRTMEDVHLTVLLHLVSKEWFYASYKFIIIFEISETRHNSLIMTKPLIHEEKDFNLISIHLTNYFGKKILSTILPERLHLYEL